MSKLTWRNSIIAGVAVTAFTLGSLSANAAGRLKAPIPDWTGGAVTCKVVQMILENELGYKVKAITMPSGAGVYEGVAAGDMNYACESWPSYSSAKDKMITKFGGDGSVAYMGSVGIVGVSSYYVPRYFVDEVAPDLKSYKELNKYKKHFATIETNGKGRLIGCPTPAWECDDQKRLDLLGVDFIASELGTETAAWAEAQAAYDRKEPFLLYAWEPHWIHAKLDLVSIELPAHNADTWPATGWAEDIPFNYGDPVSMAMDGPNADAAHLLSNMKLTNAEQAKMVLAIDVDGREIDDVVGEWLDANESTWRKWMK
jgi:ABC-type proline/glycine betaine transport system substrate-binding protein